MRRKSVAFIEAGQPDADSLASLFILLGYGGLSVSSYLHQHGYDVRYYPMFASTRLDWRHIASADYLLISAMAHTARLGYAIADAVRTLDRPGSRRPVVIFGGPHPTCEPEDALEHCDFVLTNEGEESSLELLRLLDGEAPGRFDQIKGLVYRDDSGRIVYTPRREVMTEIDFRLEPRLIAHYPGILGNLLRTGRLRFPFPVVQFSRGCPFACTFCLGMRQLGRQYRTRRAASVLTDLEQLHRLTRFPYGMFHDNDVAIRREETKDLLRAMARAKLGIHKMTAFTRVDSTKDEELWRLFDEAGIANVILGVESLSQSSLDSFQKGTTVDGVHTAMERLDRYGVRVKIVASFVVGDVENPLRELELIREFFTRYHHRLQRIAIQPLMEYPFQEKFRGQHQLYGDEKFIHYDWNFYAGDYVVFYPKACPPSRLQQALRDTFRFVHGVPDCCRGNRRYRFTQALIRYTHRGKDRNLGHYIEFLKRIERHKYDARGLLIPDALEGDIKPRDVDLGVPTRRRIKIPDLRRFPVKRGGWDDRSWRPPAIPRSESLLQASSLAPASRELTGGRP